MGDARGSGCRIPWVQETVELCRDPSRSTAITTDRPRFRTADASRKPVPVPDRDAFLRDVAAELGQHEVVGPGLLHRVISEAQRRYIAPRERATG